jgi:hypothetical protein
MGNVSQVPVSREKTDYVRDSDDISAPMQNMSLLLKTSG